MEEDNKTNTGEEEEVLGSTLTMEKVAAAKQFIENHYKNQMKSIKERKQRYVWILIYINDLSLVLVAFATFSFDLEMQCSICELVSSNCELTSRFARSSGCFWYFSYFLGYILCVFLGFETQFDC